MDSPLAHQREIAAAAEGILPARDRAVVASWLRCLNRHGLDPAHRSEAYILPETRLREHRQRSEALIEIARSGIETLFSQVAGQNYVLLLADASGVTVEYLGDAAQKAELRRSGLWLGSEWSEARAGTCATGACIETGEALTVHQSDHFDATHTGLSCTAAPIHDSQGRLSAVLDISLLTSPRPRTSQSLALNLVRAAARRIEMANIMAESRREWVLRLAGAPEFLDVDPEAALSLDGAGRVIAMTHGAQRILARAGGLDWRRPEAIIGRPVSDFLDLRLDRLDELTRQRPPAERFLTTRDGHRLFAHAIEPRRVVARAEPAVPGARGPVAVPAVLRALGGEDAGMARLLAQAARLAPTRLPILVEGETGSGKLTLARAIHAAAAGPRAPLVVIDCPGLDSHEEEARLFGTARDRSAGRIAEAAGGTLILDKVDELGLPLQARLLRLLAEGRLAPVGGLRGQEAQIRVIATAGGELAAAVAAGRFRRDLSFRLAAARLRLPPLRERDDLLQLASGMLARAGEGPVRRLAPAALPLLAAQAWPGNLRELENLLATAAALSDAAEIGPEALAPLLGPAPPGPEAQPFEARLRRALAEAGGNVSAAARRLGVHRATVHRHLQRQGGGPGRRLN